MRRFFHDLFFPHLHNNFRARFLHHQSIIFSITFLLVGSFVLSTLRTNLPQVLGISTDITTEQLLLFTNEERQISGTGPLSINDKLAKAAGDKAENMFAENYWAHNSPSGKTPWTFIKSEGYTYTYAGENLAKGFTNTEAVIKAWMNSPSHRENMLSKNYTDVGFAVREGKLGGEDTILIVEMFGNTGLSQNIATGPASIPNENKLVLNSKSQGSFIDVASLSKNFAILFTLVFVFILAMDMIIIERKKVTRFVGHNLDHIFFFSIIILIIIAIAKGSIL